VWKVLCRHGLNTRAKRLGLIAGYAAPYQPPRDPGPEQHIDVSEPDELVGIDSFYVGRLKGAEGAIWQLTAIDLASSYAWAELVICKQGNPTARQTSKLAERVARELKAAGWQLAADAQRQRQRVPRHRSHKHPREARCPSQPHPCRQTTDQRQRRGAPQDAPRRVLETRVRSLHLPELHRARKLNTYLRLYNSDRIHHRRRTQRRIPTEIVYGARKMEAR
jgi:hypothetical protein